MCREIIYFCAELLNYWSMTFFGLKLFAKVYGFEVHKNKIVENIWYALMCLPISLFAAGNAFYVVYSTSLTYIIIIYMFILIYLLCHFNKKYSIFLIALYILIVRLFDLWIVAVVTEISKISRDLDINIIHIGKERIVYLCVLFIGYYIIYNLCKQNEIMNYLKDNKRYCGIICIYSLLGNGCFSTVYQFEYLEELIGYWTFYLVCAFIFIGGFLFYIIKSKNREKEKIMNMRNNMLESRYHDLQKVYEINRMLQHDYKNHLLAINELIKEHKNKDALDYIATYIKYSKETLNVIECGNDIINIILNSKMEEAKQKKIIFTCELDALEDVKMCDIDMCALLGNLLDNAIEACEKVEDGNAKIDLKIIKRNEMIIIKLKNSIHPNTLNKKKLFKTEKTNSQLHGWGIRSIENVVYRYGGTKVCYIDDKRIELLVTIPN